MNSWSKPLSVFRRSDKRLDHFSIDEVAVELIQLRQPEVITRIVSVRAAVWIAPEVAGAGRKGLLSMEIHDPHFDPVPGHMAWLSASQGNKEKTLEYLNRVLQERGTEAFFLPFINVDPLYDFLRDDPRFKENLHRMNLP